MKGVSIQVERKIGVMLYIFVVRVQRFGQPCLLRVRRCLDPI